MNGYLESGGDAFEQSGAVTERERAAGSVAAMRADSFYDHVIDDSEAEHMREVGGDDPVPITDFRCRHVGDLDEAAVFA
jgi:hypothetical protein